MNKSMVWAGQSACIGKLRNEYKIWGGKLNLTDLGVMGGSN